MRAKKASDFHRNIIPPGAGGRICRDSYFNMPNLAMIRLTAPAAQDFVKIFRADRLQAWAAGSSPECPVNETGEPAQGRVSPTCVPLVESEVECPIQPWRYSNRPGMLAGSFSLANRLPPRLNMPPRAAVLRPQSLNWNFLHRRSHWSGSSDQFRLPHPAFQSVQVFADRGQDL